MVIELVDMRKWSPKSTVGKPKMPSALLNRSLKNFRIEADAENRMKLRE